MLRDQDPHDKRSGIKSRQRWDESKRLQARGFMTHKQHITIQTKTKTHGRISSSYATLSNTLQYTTHSVEDKEPIVN